MCSNSVAVTYISLSNLSNLHWKDPCQEEKKKANFFVVVEADSHKGQKDINFVTKTRIIRNTDLRFV